MIHARTKGVKNKNYTKVKVTGVGTGTVRIVCYGQNGVYKTVTVTVR